MRLLDRLAHHAHTRPAVSAYRDAATGASLSWRELHDQVSADAGGAARRSPALIRLPNTLHFPVAFLSKLLANRPAFPVPPNEPMGQVPWLLVERTPAIAAGARLLLLSSGSTGVPKVVCRSAPSLDAVCEQMVSAIGMSPDDHVLATVPLCHSYGIEHGLLAPVWAGATVTLCRGLELAVVQRQLKESRITVLPGVPSTFEALSRLDVRLDRVKAYSAGGPLPAAVAAACRERLGLSIGQVYGATEIGSVTYGTDPDGSVGRPMPGVTIRIDEDGQVMVAARSLFDGYLGEPNPTTAEGFYPTGDLGHVDDAGRLHVTGRARLLIDVGGRKVNPLEVESVLMDHPRVAGCVVVPVQQTATVARLKAVVEPRGALDVEELRAFARDRLAAHKVPRSFEVRDALPRSAAGKVLRGQVDA